MKRHNLGTVVSFEVTRTLTKRWFWIATMIVPISIGVVMGLIIFASSATRSQADSQKSAKFTFTYSDASGYVDPAIVKAFGGSTAIEQAQAISDVKSAKIDAYFAYPSDPVKQPIRVYGIDRGIFENGKYSAVASNVLVLSAQGKIGDKALAALAQGTIPLTSTTYKAGRESGGINEVIPPMVFLAIFYAVVLLLGNQMLASLLEEKENRVTEMLLTTLDPATLVVGKIISLFIVGTVQMLAFAVPIVVGYLFFRTELNLPYIDLSHLVFNPGPMIFGALLLVGGFTLFATTLATVGAVMPTARDAGQVVAPLTILNFVPLWTISLVISNPHSFIVGLFTYFPYTAPATAMLRNGFGSLSALEAVIVIGELLLLGAIMLRLAIRVFQHGSIEYSRKVSLGSVFAVREQRG